MTEALRPPTLDEIRAAAERLRGRVLRTPLVRFRGHDGPGEIWLKLENLQPIGSFKVRGAGNALAQIDPAELTAGVYTASAGNMAQGLAWAARDRGIRATAVVPEHVPETKLAAIARLGGEVLKVPFDEWWRVMVEHRHRKLDGRFVHPVCDPAVIAGNGTVGVEILEELDEVDAIVVPYGGGGLSCGIAAAARTLASGVRVYGAEVDTAAPLAASWAAGEARAIDYTPSFVDGIGAKSVLAEMWPMARDLLAGSITSSLDEIAEALRQLIEHNRVVAEGAGATSLAAALSGGAGSGRVVCVISGGNIDRTVLARILSGESAS